MSDLLNIIPVREVLSRAGVKVRNENFEVLYSKLLGDPSKASALRLIEKIVYDYFSSIQISEEPTIYDRLLLSLRSKDVIATFNWDPLLLQAACRNPILRNRVPTMHFLHGNVLSAYCYRDGTRGMKGMNCSRCGFPLTPSKLLYPVAEKDYSDPVIADSWVALKAALKSACFVTIFGYSAPVADQKARSLLQDAWGNRWQRKDEQVEIIDTAGERILKTSWESFVHPDHYEIHKDYSESWVARHPRRTAEAWLGQYFEIQFLQDDPLPHTGRFGGLAAHVKELIKAEEYTALLNNYGEGVL